MGKPCLAVQPGGPVLTARGDAPGGAVRGGNTAPQLGRGAPTAAGSSGAGRAGAAASPSSVQPTPAQPRPHHCRCSPLDCRAVPGCFGAACKCSPGWQEREKAACLGLTQLLLCLLPLHRPPEGVEGAQVTQLPSIKLLLQELSSRHAVSVPPASALPPDAAPAQHQAHRFSPSALFPLPR